MDIKTMVNLYTVNHLTMDEIGRIAGITRQAVYKHLKKANISSDMGEKVVIFCDLCGKQATKYRKQWRSSIKHFCSIECYHISLESPGYHPWRQGQRLARIIVGQFFKLESGHVVHHVDNDNRNNDKSNLMVFANQSDHLKFHCGTTTTPQLWPQSLTPPGRVA